MEMTLLFVHQVDDKLDFLLSRVVNTSTQLSLFFIIFKIIFTKICEMENRKNHSLNIFVKEYKENVRMHVVYS